MSKQAENIIEKFGGITPMAKALGHKYPSTVQGWKERGFIPASQQQAVLNRGHELGIDIAPDDFFTEQTDEKAA